MLRRFCPLRTPVFRGAQLTSRPVYEVLYSKLATSSTDSTSPRAAAEVALLHAVHVHTLGDYLHISAKDKQALVMTDAGKEAAKILDEALELEAPESSQPKMLILYGSQTGTAKGLATMTALMAKSTAGLDPVVLSLNDGAKLLQDPNRKNKFAACMILTSTYGEGDHPTNAMQFWQALSAPNSALAAKLKTVGPISIFGLGNSSNSTNFNASAKRFVEKFKELGITDNLCPPIFSCELAPEHHDAVFRTWKSACWAALAKRGIGSGNTTAQGGIADTYEISQTVGIPAEKKHISLKREGWFEAPVSYNEVKSAKSYSPRHRHAVVELDLRKVESLTGARRLKITDQLCVQPHNPKSYVDKALKLFGLSGKEVFDITPLPGAPSESWFNGHKLSAHMIFSEVIDLSAFPSRSTLAALATRAQDPKEKATLELLANDLSAKNEYSRLTHSVFTVLDVLERFPSLKLTLANAFTLLPHIAPRFYSNAHDPSKLPNKFEIVYNVPQRQRPDGGVHLGLCTGGLEELVPSATNSSLWCSIEQGKTTLPDVKSPTLFIGLGTGIGLIRAALQARAAVKAAGEKVGPAKVIYGFRQSGKDELFHEELLQWQKEGIIEDLRLVASYDEAGKFKNPFHEIDSKMAVFINQPEAELLYCGIGGSVPNQLEQQLRRAGVRVAKKKDKMHMEYFSADLDFENQFKAEVEDAGATLAQRYRDSASFCFQCAQCKNGTGCHDTDGVCGKTPSCAALQDLTVYYTKAMGFYLHNLRKVGAPEIVKLNRLTLYGLFTTLTNVNFDDARFVSLLGDLHAGIQEAKKSYVAFCASKNITPEAFPADQMLINDDFVADHAELVATGRAVGVLTRFEDAATQDSAVLGEMATYGLKGLAAYTDHALMNGVESPEIYAYLHKALAFLLSPDRHDVGKILDINLECGKVNVTAMSQLYNSHKTLGVPSPHKVSCKPKPGKCILVSGHDLIILRELLPLCEKHGINVYTHGEMLPAHGYPELRRSPALAGQFGTAWYRQQLEMAHFPGAVLMTTNCLTLNHSADKLFTAGAVGATGLQHIGNTLADIDFTPLINKALSMPGFTDKDTDFGYADPVGQGRADSLMVGFGHEAILGLAPAIIAEIGKGNITRFFVIGGCDGYDGTRSYYSDLARELPKTAIILTVGCGKFRLTPLADELGTIPGDSGIPRLLDLGQCNDSFSAVQIALALASVLKCEVSDLPLSIVLSWFEQKAVAVLLSCIALGLKPLRVGPTLPAFVTPAVLKVMVEKFGIKPVGDPAQDAKIMCSAKGMIEK